MQMRETLKSSRPRPMERWIESSESPVRAAAPSAWPDGAHSRRPGQPGWDSRSATRGGRRPGPHGRTDCSAGRGPAAGRHHPWRRRAAAGRPSSAAGPGSWRHRQVRLHTCNHETNTLFAYTNKHSEKKVFFYVSYFFLK
jgi:hypothetical protein